MCVCERGGEREREGGRERERERERKRETARTTERRAREEEGRTPWMYLKREGGKEGAAGCGWGVTARARIYNMIYNMIRLRRHLRASVGSISATTYAAFPLPPTQHFRYEGLPLESIPAASPAWGGLLTALCGITKMWSLIV